MGQSVGAICYDRNNVHHGYSFIFSDSAITFITQIRCYLKQYNITLLFLSYNPLSFPNPLYSLPFSLHPTQNSLPHQNKTVKIKTHVIFKPRDEKGSAASVLIVKSCANVFGLKDFFSSHFCLFLAHFLKLLHPFNFLQICTNLSRIHQQLQHSTSQTYPGLMNQL